MQHCFTIFFSFLFFISTLTAQNLPPYKNKSLPAHERVRDLLKRMTLEEKTAQLSCVWSQRKILLMDKNGVFNEAKAAENFKHGLGEVGRPNEALGDEYISVSLGPAETARLSNDIQKYFVEKTRLGIPVLFHEESLHGNQAKDATHFPSHLALGCSWNPDLLKEIYSAVALEVRARGAQQVLAPVVDLGLDPRWGRIEETLGEDPYHVSQMSLAEVKAYQGGKKEIDKKHVIATLKHFGVHGQPEGGINVAPNFADERTLRQIFFPPFQTCVIEGGAQGIMPCYNELSGIPAHTNRRILTDILRKEWGFSGIVVSDYYGIQDLFTLHHVAKDTAEAARQALEAGVDVETPFDFAYSRIPSLVRSGKINISLVDTAVSRVLLAKFNTGLFDDPYTNVEEAVKIVGSDEHRSIALKAAQESMVLLKNKGGLLPLDISKYKRIAVIGPNADRCILGGYSNSPKVCVTPLQGISEKFRGKSEILYSEGCRITDAGDWFKDSVKLSSRPSNLLRITKAVELAKACDIVLLFVGGNEATAREEWAANHLGDRPSLELIGEQNQLIESLARLGKPMATFIFTGPPVASSLLEEKSQSLVQCWYLGQETGRAVADLISGDINPSGKLSISIPRSVGHIPAYYYYKPSARRGYIFDEVKPLYSFGHGLSFTTFSLKTIIDKNVIHKNDHVKVRINVTNTGRMRGAEVVQLYICDKVSSVTRPVKELKRFQKVWLDPGESKEITFELGPEDFKFYNRELKWVAEPGEFDLMIGNSSDNLNTFPLTLQE